MAGDLLLLNVRPAGGPTTDIVVRNGSIAAVGKRPVDWEGPTVDGLGALLLPGLIDGHAHVDKSRLGLPWRPFSAGEGIAALIANEREHRDQIPPAVEAATTVLEAYVGNGTTHACARTSTSASISA
jgi:cytosine/adenosine deaminase-related metal-dependent hydrolase